MIEVAAADAALYAPVRDEAEAVSARRGRRRKGAGGADRARRPASGRPTRASSACAAARGPPPAGAARRPGPAAGGAETRQCPPRGRRRQRQGRRRQVDGGAEPGRRHGHARPPRRSARRRRLWPVDPAHERAGRRAGDDRRPQAQAAGGLGPEDHVDRLSGRRGLADDLARADRLVRAEPDAERRAWASEASRSTCWSSTCRPAPATCS